jgi:hypothetical protein
MLQLKPYPDNCFVCPKCRAERPRINQFTFESINILADCSCNQCGFEFYQVLPVGHTVDYQISIGKKEGNIFQPQGCPAWLSLSLLQAHEEVLTTEVPIERIIFKQCNNIVILNTLDSLYGHVLLKLYNAFHHIAHQPDVGLIIIIPKGFKWLIPSGCAEAWVVDLTLSELKFSYESIQDFFAKQFDRFSEINLSKAFSHPNLGPFDIERLTGVKPFNLEQFNEKEPVVTFVLREDRWWFKNRIDFWFYRVCRKLKISSWGSHIHSERQNQLIKRVIKLMKREIADIKCFVVGLGEIGDFGDYAIDLRYRKTDSSIEMEWCEIYARSHVVIGIHGSNMLLPTALAAGCVEILPEDRYGNMLQDISIRYNDRQQLFFYRFADQFANPDSVAAKAVAIVRDYEIYKRNMCVNIYSGVTSMTSLMQDDDSNH